MTDPKYTTFKEIYTRVSSVIKGKFINPADVLNWAVECEVEWIMDFPAFIPYYEVRLDVRDKQARVPAYCQRILDVYKNPDDQSSHVKYYHQGVYINLNSDYELDYIYINFIGIPIDPETDTPLIRRGHEEACVQHILCKLYYEDYLNGKISPQIYAREESKRDLYVRAAQSDISAFSRRELMEIAAINLNMIPYIRYDSLVNKTIGG